MTAKICLQLKDYSEQLNMEINLFHLCYCSVCKRLKLVFMFNHKITTPPEHTNTVECFGVSMIQTVITCSLNCLFQHTALQRKHVHCLDSPLVLLLHNLLDTLTFSHFSLSLFHSRFHASLKVLVVKRYGEDVRSVLTHCVTPH